MRTAWLTAATLSSALLMACDRTPETPAVSPRGDASTAAPRWREVTVPAGTALPLDLITPVSSGTARVETPVRARLRQAVVVDGYTALPAGTVLTGEVIDVARAGRVRGRSRLALRFTGAELRSGREELRANPIAFEGAATKGEDATKVGAGANLAASLATPFTVQAPAR